MSATHMLAEHNFQSLACRICDGPVQDPFQQDRQWWVADRWCQANASRPAPGDSWSLDVELMQEAAACLAGRRCFAAFRDPSERLSGNSIRHVWSLQVLSIINEFFSPLHNLRALGILSSSLALAGCMIMKHGQGVGS